MDEDNLKKKKRKIMIALTSRYHYYYDQQSSNDGKLMLVPAGTIGAQATIQGKSSHLDFIGIEMLNMMHSIFVPINAVVANHQNNYQPPSSSGCSKKKK